jgi:TRAP-type C4-dicarboxylate transport system permease small subunit
MMRRRIDKVVGFVLVVLMVVMTVDVLWGVFTRYAMGNQASWSEELARFLLIWIGILGAAYASGQKMHLAIDLLRSKLSENGQKRLSTFICTLVTLFSICVLIIGGLRLIYITEVLGQLSPALRVPMAGVYMVVPISGVLVVYYQIQKLKEVYSTQTAE